MCVYITRGGIDSQCLIPSVYALRSWSASHTSSGALVHSAARLEDTSGLNSWTPSVSERCARRKPTPIRAVSARSPGLFNIVCCKEYNGMKALRLSSGLRVAAELPLRPVKMKSRRIDGSMVAKRKPSAARRAFDPRRVALARHRRLTFNSLAPLLLPPLLLLP